MSEKMFSREQYGQWRSFPEISRDELFRYFTLTSVDVAFVDPGAGRGPADRLGIAVQLSTLPWLGFVPDDVAAPGGRRVLAGVRTLPALARRRVGQRPLLPADIDEDLVPPAWRPAVYANRELAQDHAPAQPGRPRR